VIADNVGDVNYKTDCRVALELPNLVFQAIAVSERCWQYHTLLSLGSNAQLPLALSEVSFTGLILLNLY
jgi:hypothetical protein